MEAVSFITINFTNYVSDSASGTRKAKVNKLSFSVKFNLRYCNNMQTSIIYICTNGKTALGKALTMRSEAGVV